MAASSSSIQTAAKQAIWPYQQDENEDDKDRRILQLQRYHQGRELLNDADSHSAPERTANASHSAHDDAGIHDDDEVDADKRLRWIIEHDQAARDARNSGAKTEGNAMRP